MFDGLDIIVVSTGKRNSLIAPYLRDFNPKISVTPDYALPVGFSPTCKGLFTHNHLGTYRCFRGHQDAIAKAVGEHALIFEDDAVPNRTDWFQVVNECVTLLSVYDVVSLHGRQYNKDEFKEILYPIAFKFLCPLNTSREGLPWVVAALAYLVSKKNYKKMTELVYDGTPWDIVLYRNFSYCLMKRSPFNHNRSQGSLIDGYKA